VTLRVPKLRRQTFETAIIRALSAAREFGGGALIEMYLAGVSVRRWRISPRRCGTRVSRARCSNLNQKIYGQIEAWRHRPIEGEQPYVYLDGIVLKRSWAGEVRNVSLLVAISVNATLPADPRIVEGAKEDRPAGAVSWPSQGRGLRGVELIVSDACIGLVESAPSSSRRALAACMVHSIATSSAMCAAGKLRVGGTDAQAIHAQEDLAAAHRKAAEWSSAPQHEARKQPSWSRRRCLRTLAYYAFRKSTGGASDRQSARAHHARDPPRTRVVGAFRTATRPQSGRPAAPHRRHALVDQTISHMELLRQRNA